MAHPGSKPDARRSKSLRVSQGRLRSSLAACSYWQLRSGKHTVRSRIQLKIGIWRGRFRFNGIPASPREEVGKVERRHSDMYVCTRPMLTYGHCPY